MVLGSEGGDKQEWFLELSTVNRWSVAHTHWAAGYLVGKYGQA